MFHTTVHFVGVNLEYSKPYLNLENNKFWTLCTWCMEFTTFYRIIFWWSIFGLLKALFYTQAIWLFLHTGNMAISYLKIVNRPCAKQWKLVKAVSFVLNYLQKNVEVGFVMNSRDIVVLYYYAHLIIKVCGTICTSKSFCLFGLLQLFYDHCC